MFNWLRTRAPRMTDARADRFAYGFADFECVPTFVRDAADLPCPREHIEAGIDYLVAREQRIAEADSSQRWEIRGRVQSLRDLRDTLNEYVQVEPKDAPTVAEANAAMAALGSDAPDDEVDRLFGEMQQDPRYQEICKYHWRRHSDATPGP